MPVGIARFIAIVFGAALAILGLGGVPLAVQAGSLLYLILATLSLFIGIGILGWAYKE